MGKRGFAHLILVLVVAGVAVLAIYFKTSVKKTDQTVSTQTEQSPSYWETGSDETPTPTANIDTPTPTIPDPYGFEIPPLPSDLEWSVVNSEDRSLNKLGWRDLTDTVADGEISLKGTEWQAFRTIHSDSERQNPDFMDPTYEFRNSLLERQWGSEGQAFYFDKYDFQVLGASGVQYDSDGLFKNHDQKIRLVYYSRYVDKIYFKDNSPSQLVYPYSAEYRIFVSEVLPLKDLVTQVEATRAH